jgi:hypothetical protein
MSDNFGSLLEDICTRDISIARPPVLLAVSIRDKDYLIMVILMFILIMMVL